MRAAGASVEVQVLDEQSDLAIDVAEWERLAVAVLVDEGMRSTQVCVSFVDERAIASLKTEYLGGSGEATDVLAFPVDAPVEVTGCVPHMLGDVVICPTVAARQAPEHAGSFEDELALLVVHGLLHLMGMDHEVPAERRAMQGRERLLLERLYGTFEKDPWHQDQGGVP